MRVVRLLAARTFGRLCHRISAALSFGAFLAAGGFLFSVNLAHAEGGLQPLSTLWAASVAPVLPFLAALYGMDVWGRDREGPRLANLLTVSASEGELVAGAFFGVWGALLAAAFASAAGHVFLLRILTPSAHVGGHAAGWILAFAAIAVQGALWSAAAVAASAFFRTPALAATVAIALSSLAPRAIWTALLEWAPAGRSAFGEFPFDAHTFDFASGGFSVATLVAYAVLTVLLLFWAATAIASCRLVGRGARRERVLVAALRISSGIFAALFLALAFRFDAVAELPFGAVRTGFSDRTRTILSESQGEVAATAFVPRTDVRRRAVLHLLRAFRTYSRAQGGCRFEVRTVDPHWDFASAHRLSRDGVPSPSVVFERGPRRVVVPLDEGFDERVFASAVLRVTQPPQRTVVYWTHGHGEASFDDYGDAGASDFARELARDGYRHRSLDLAADEPIPSDCALIVVAGLRVDFSHSETDRLDAYLRQGGRLLLTAAVSPQGGFASMLSAWGLRAGVGPVASARTLSGSDTVVTEFSSHPVVRPLAGSQIVLENPVGFLPSTAATAETGADRIAFDPLAHAGGVCVAAATERGGALGGDLALRPTRIVAVGDGLFALNGQLRARGNANRAFLQNCVSHLAGNGAAMTGARTVGALVTGLDRAGRVRFSVACALAFPAMAVCLLVMPAFFRRRRL